MMMHTTCKIQIQETIAIRKWIIPIPAIVINGMNPVINPGKTRIIATPEEVNNKIALIMNPGAGQAIVLTDKTEMMIMVTGNHNKGIIMTVTNKIGEINPAVMKEPAMDIMKPVTGMIAAKGIGVVTAIPVAGIKMIAIGMI